MSFTKIESKKPWGIIGIFFYTLILKLKIASGYVRKVYPTVLVPHKILFKSIFQVWLGHPEI